MGQDVYREDRQKRHKQKGYQYGKKKKKTQLLLSEL